jgi:hypothetical protein
MRYMKDYSEFPPLKYFTRVLKNCPKAALLYIEIWRKKSKQMITVIQKKDIRKEYLMSPTMFRNLLAPLMFINLISFNENDEKYRIDIMGQPLNE